MVLTRCRPMVVAAAALALGACQRDEPAAEPSPAPVVEAPTTAPDSAPPPTSPAGAPTAFDCGGTAVQASFDGDQATVLLDGESIALSTVPAASGARYQGMRADGVTVELWTKGAAATLSVAGNAYPECTSAAPEVKNASPAVASPYRARGSEPDWSIETLGDELRWTTAESPEPVLWTGVARAARADGFDLAASRDGGALALSATATICRDRMSGMPYPHTVTATIDDREYRGCGGEAIELLTANEWTVARIGETAMTGRAPTLQFAADGRASGFAGCNRWTAGATLSGEGLSLGLAAATKMACLDQTASTQESAFLDALGRITRHDFDANGDLLLKAGDETVIVATAGAPPAA